MKKKVSVKKPKVMKKKSGPKSAVKSSTVVEPDADRDTKRAGTEMTVGEKHTDEVVADAQTEVTESPDPAAYNPEQQMAGTEAARKLGMKHTIVRN